MVGVVRRVEHGNDMDTDLSLLPSLREFVRSRDDSAQKKHPKTWPFWKPERNVPAPILFSAVETKQRAGTKDVEETVLSEANDKREDSLEELLEDELRAGNEKYQNEKSSTVLEVEKTEEESMKDQAIRQALRGVGFSSWDEFLGNLVHATESLVSTRKRSRKKKGSTINLADVLNGNSPYYHASFARAYQKARQKLHKQARVAKSLEQLQEYSSLSTRWSDLTTAEHSWFLTHQHRSMKKAEQQRFIKLKEKIQKEQDEFWREMYARGHQHRARYDHVTERQTVQLLKDNERRKRRLLEIMPPVLRHVEDFPTTKDASQIEETSQSAQVKFVKILGKFGKAPKILPLEKGTSLKGDKFYLPPVVSNDQPCVECAYKDIDPATWTYRRHAPPEIYKDESFQKLLAHPLLNNNNDKIGTPLTIAVSAGALQGMLRYDMLQQQCSPVEIPVIVEHDPRVCYIGKPLLRKSEMRREKQQRVQKYAVISEAMAQGAAANVHADQSPSVNTREATYSLWKVEDDPSMQIILRSHARVECIHPVAEDNEGGKGPFDRQADSSILAVKTEYLPEPDTEDTTLENIADWSSKFITCPEANTIQIAHVSIPVGRISSWESLSRSALESMCIEEGIQSRRTWASEPISFSMPSALSRVIGWISLHGNKIATETMHLLSLTPRTTDGEGISMFLDSTQAADQPGGRAPYRVHEAHISSTSTDIVSDPFIPPRWRPFDPSIAQVPYTFPPRQVKPATSERRELEQEETAPHTGAGAEKNRHTALSDMSHGQDKSNLAPRPRRFRMRRRHVPWQGDMDQVSHMATISRSQYEAHLAEEL